MKQVAFINKEGEISYIISPGSDDMYTNGEFYGELQAIDISSFEDPSKFAKTKYYKDGKWYDREELPGPYYVWSNCSWSLDEPKLTYEVRKQRNYKLQSSDWTQLQDNNLSPETKQQWAVYRQSLRDLDFSGVKHINEVAWPIPPA